ncbi:MAG TPA: hypothetical protein VK673_12085 [Chthoniobacterales bacterium]|nr:hypothetical protein [Chthoniobacterales bacterium]
MINNESTKKKKLSQRPLRRYIQFECQLGPHFTSTVPGQPNKLRSSQRYCLWTADLPKGKKNRRFMAAVQEINRPGNMGDTLHNSLVFAKAVVLPDNQDSELVAKGCYRKAQKFLYYLIKDMLARVTRPTVKVCGGDGSQLDAYWHTYDVGMCGSSELGQFRELVISEVGNKYLGNSDHMEAA